LSDFARASQAATGKKVSADPKIHSTNIYSSTKSNSSFVSQVLLALIGGQFPSVQEGEICGAVVSIRYNEDILGVWNRNSQNRDVTERIRDAIKRVLQLPPQAYLEYKPHGTALQDKSSFRNTQVWKPKVDRSDSRGETRRPSSWGERDKGGSRWR
jgi:hypothetical protein